MNTTLQEFSQKIDQLVSYIEKTDSIHVIAEKNNEEECSKAYLALYKIEKRKYDYYLIIVTLYGIFENFNEEMIQAYLKQLKKSVSCFSELPETIVKRHTILSAELIISSMKQPKFSDVRPTDVIRNLNHCLDGQDLYELNTKAFTKHSMNFRQDTINTFYSEVGIDSIINRIKGKSSIVSYYTIYYGMTEAEIKKSKDNLFSDLEDLVNRRNLIAHGNGGDDLLSKEMLIQYANFIKAMIESIYSELIDNYHYEIFKSKRKISLGKPIIVHGNKIVCISTGGTILKKNDTLYARNSKGKIIYGKIVNLRHGKTDIEHTIEGEKIDVGIMVDFHVKENYEYFIIKPLPV